MWRAKHESIPCFGCALCFFLLGQQGFFCLLLPSLIFSSSLRQLQIVWLSLQNPPSLSLPPSQWLPSHPLPPPPSLLAVADPFPSLRSAAMTALQASLLFRPLPFLPHSRPPERLLPRSSLRRSAAVLIRSHRRLAHARALRALPPESAESALEPASPSTDRSFELSQEIGGDSSRREPIEAVLDGEVENGAAPLEDPSNGKMRTQNTLPLVVFLMRVLASARKGFDALVISDWLNWWPFWRREQRLERLIADADANPKDPSKQSTLLAELNKHRFCCGNPFLHTQSFSRENNFICC